MNALRVTLVALAAAVTLTPVAAAGTQAVKQRVAITVTMMNGTAVLTPLKNGALKRDTGTFSGDFSEIPDRTVVRNGQTVDIYHAVWTFTGKRGSLVFRGRSECVALGHDLNRDGSADEICVGTWQIVRGTRTYARVKGGGRSAQLGQGTVWVQRYEGLLTSP